MTELTERRGIGRPRSIDRDKIVAAAQRLGVENLTMRAVAEELGVTTQALYNHIGGRRELLVLLANDYSELFELDDEADPSDWRAWLTTFASGLRRHLRTQPGLAASVVTQGPTTPAALRFAERAVDTLGEAGFSPADALRAYRIVLEYVVGWSQRHDRGTGPDHGVVRLAEGDGTSRHWPHIAGAWAVDNDELFDFGLRCLLDGFTRLLDAGRQEPVIQL